MTPVEILLVEDNPGHVRLMEEALKASRLTNPMKVARCGEEALRCLRDPGSSPRPGLVLLDLHLPDRDGWEVLGEIKQDPALRRLPVVLQTSSREDEDLLAAATYRVSGYIAKPVDGTKLLAVLGALEEFRLTLVQG